MNVPRRNGRHEQVAALAGPVSTRGCRGVGILSVRSPGWKRIERKWFVLILRAAAEKGSDTLLWHGGVCAPGWTQKNNARHPGPAVYGRAADLIGRNCLENLFVDLCKSCSLPHRVCTSLNPPTVRPWHRLPFTSVFGVGFRSRHPQRSVTDV
jgi:hypothetical protein